MNAADYDAQCAAAVERQGLTPALDALRAAGVTASADQTGGFTMCVRVERSAADYLYVTATEVGPDGTWMVYRYNDNDDLFAEGLLVGDGLTDEEMVEKCRYFVTRPSATRTVAVAVRMDVPAHLTDEELADAMSAHAIDLGGAVSRVDVHSDPAVLFPSASEVGS